MRPSPPADTLQSDAPKWHNASGGGVAVPALSTPPISAMKRAQMRQQADRALIAIAVGFLLLAASVLGTAWLAERQHQAFQLVRHTLEVENRLSAVLSDLQDAETSVRGYAINRQEDFLEPYTEAAVALPQELDALDAEIRDNPRQRASMARLRPLAAQRMAMFAESVARLRGGQSLDDLKAHYGDQGRHLGRELRGLIGQMRNEEARLLALRSQAATDRTQLVTVGLIVSALATLLLGGFAFMDGRRRLSQALAAADVQKAVNAELKAEAAQREAAESQVRQMQKMESLGQLTGGVAHDFNNMLAIVLGSLELAKRRLKGGEDPRVLQAIDNAVEGAERAAQLTQRLLVFSRQSPLEPRVLDFNKLVGGMSELLRRTIGEQLKVETVLAGGLWRVRVDPGQLEAAVLNLCVNSRDAMPEGGRLTIETANAHLDDAYAEVNAEAQAGQYVMVSVTDTGIGMPADVAERAFDPFFTTKGAGRGTGLGLSQVHGFIRQSGGHVKIYSEPGVGTTVKLYLPRHYGQDAVHDVGEAAALAAPRGRPEEIVLVVEDEERVRHLTVDGLRELGYTVVQAADANQALAVLELQPRVDLLFTDIVMPDMNGRKLADLAREKRPDLKVLYTTGYTRNAIVHNGVLDPGVSLLQKPFTLERLARKVRQELDAAPEATGTEPSSA